MQYDGGGTFIPLNTVNNGIPDAAVVGLDRAERKQRVQGYGLLAAAAPVQPLRRNDIEGQSSSTRGRPFSRSV